MKTFFQHDLQTIPYTTAAPNRTYKIKEKSENWKYKAKFSKCISVLFCLSFSNDKVPSENKHTPSK